MPASHKSSSQDPSQPVILLLEEYDALATAICLALRKFAPGHTTLVAPSLREAEVLAGKSKPELFIIDFDPSYPGLPAFLQKAQSILPDARALVLAGRIPAEIIAKFQTSGALQFLQKPYDIGVFGAAVQTLLVPPGLTESSGALRHLGLAELIALSCIANHSAILDVKGSAGAAGTVHVANGHLVHAETGQRSGLVALIEMLNWPAPRVQETVTQFSVSRSIQGPWSSVLLDAWRQTSLEKGEEKKRHPRTGKKIVIVDDTEMLLIFAEDVLSSANPELQITKARTGNDGVKEIERALPDLILLDYNLPDINGDEVCRRLLANERTAHIPVLMMSGHVAQMNVTAEKFKNIVATIEKPFLSEPFVDLVGRTLEAGPRTYTAPKPESPSRPPTTSPSPAEKTKRPAPVKATPKEPSPKISSSAVVPLAAAPAVASEPMAEKALSTASVVAPSPSEFARTHRTEAPTISATVAPIGENDVVLGLFLEVLSMQLTPQLRMGAIRARPASSTVSLHFLSLAARGAIPTETGFQLGATELDEKGHLATLRLIPTAKPFQPSAMRNAFEIGGVALVPNDNRARVQLTPAGTTPMTMELLARLELAGVALSPTFQVAHLVLKWRGDAVRVTLDSKAPEQSGAEFKAAVKLDTLGRIAELLLQPAK